MGERWQDVTVGPLRCIVCGGLCTDAIGDSVRAPATALGAIYGLHAVCTAEFRARGSWSRDGYPIIKPNLEDRVAALEKRLGTD